MKKLSNPVGKWKKKPTELKNKESSYLDKKLKKKTDGFKKVLIESYW